MTTAMLRFARHRLPLQGQQPLWLMAASTVAGLSASLAAPWHGMWAETRPEVQAAAAAALLGASALLAWITPRPKPAARPAPRRLAREAFEVRVARHLARDDGSPAALILCEITAPASDRRGSGAGADTAVLGEAEARLARLLPEGAVATRWRDERFVIFLAGQTDPLAVLMLARDLTQPAPDPGLLAGIALAPVDGQTLDALLDGAELALAEARRTGQPGYCFFAPQLAADARRLDGLQRAIRQAVQSDALRLDFQPVYDMRSGALAGFEALVRLHDPELGPIPPSEFIPLAEREGQIVGIGQWTLEEACRVAAQWPAHLVVAVNLSPAELLSGTIVNSVRRALQRHALPAYRLEVEITEGTLMTDCELVLSQLRLLRDMGVGVALDDFGTGYSSLSYLCRFPFSKLKVDRSFAAALDHSASAKGVLRAIVRLGHGLGMTVTAEGIETERQLTLLRGIGCDLAQGYLLGRPAPLCDLAAIILRNFAEGLARRPRGSRSSAA